MTPTRVGNRAGAALTIAALAALVAGCASGGSGIQPGERVDVYVSMPLHGPESANGRDIVDGARLALADARRKVGELAVRATYLDDTAGNGPDADWSPSVAAGNARRATQDSAAIAYIGEFDSGATRFSLRSRTRLICSRSHRQRRRSTWFSRIWARETRCRRMCSRPATGRSAA